MVNPLHPNITMYIPHTVICKFLKELKGRLCNNQVFLEFAITSFILVTTMFDSGAITLREIRCLSLLGVEVLSRQVAFYTKGDFPCMDTLPLTLTLGLNITFLSFNLIIIYQQSTR